MDNTVITEQSEAVAAIQTLLQDGEEQYKLVKELLPTSLPGVLSLAHRLRTEINVLHKGLHRGDWLKLEHVNSSNLHQLGAVVHLSTALGNKVDGVLQKFRDEASVPVFVDIVANGGLLWLKVVCRCPNTLQLAHLTGGRVGERPPLEQAEVLQRLASQHTVLYTRPKVAMVFCKGVSYSVCRALREQGVLVLTHRLIPDTLLAASRYTDTFDDGTSSIGEGDVSDDGDLCLREEDVTRIGDSSEGENELFAATAENEMLKVASKNSLNESLKSLQEPRAVDFLALNENSDGRNDIDDEIESRLSNDGCEAPTLFDINTELEQNNALNLLDSEKCNESNLKKPWTMCSKEEMKSIAESLEAIMTHCDLVSKAQKSRALVTDSEKSNTKYSDSISKGALIPNSTCIVKHRPEEEHSTGTQDDASVELKSVDKASDNTTVQLQYSDPPQLPNPISPLLQVNDPPLATLPGALALDSTTFPPSPNDGGFVCLDVPCMIAYVSNTTNGGAGFSFQDKFLQEQAMWELNEPVNPVMEAYWRGQRVLVCEEAVKRFESIVGVMAGPEERRRADQLLSAVTIVPDCEDLQDALSVCGGITASARTVFGTALHYRAPVITANRRFVRAAHTQGVRIAALLHSPRALTEQKQAPLPDQTS